MQTNRPIKLEGPRDWRKLESAMIALAAESGITLGESAVCEADLDTRDYGRYRIFFADLVNPDEKTVVSIIEDYSAYPPSIMTLNETFALIDQWEQEEESEA